MKFLIGRWAQSLIKKSIAAVVAVVTGPQLAPWLTQFGVTVDPVVMSAGVFAALEGGRTWLTHQPWWEKMPWWVQALA